MADPHAYNVRGAWRTGAETTYSQPTTLWRLQRHDDGRIAHAVIVPRLQEASAVWFIDDKPEEAKDFLDWPAAVAWCEWVRTKLLGKGWSDVTPL